MRNSFAVDSSWVRRLCQPLFSSCASSSCLFPDLLFIRVDQLSGTSVNHARFKGIGSGADAEVSVFSFGYNAKGEHHLHHSTGSLTDPPSGLQTHSDMFWHDAPTRPGSSDGLIVSRGKVIGMCLGGALEDGSKNIALHFESPRIHTGFPGIAGYATALIPEIANVSDVDQYHTTWQCKVDYEKLLAAEGKQMKPGAQTADELRLKLSQEWLRVHGEFTDFCCQHNIPGLIVHTPSDVIFDIRTQEFGAADESSPESSAAMPDWYALADGDPVLVLKWQSLNHLLLTVNEINGLINDAVIKNVTAAAEFKEMVACHDSHIRKWCLRA